jgi:intraflagellar transport protein 46
LQEIAELFEHIGRYSPHIHELPTRLKPFIPDFMPSVGDIDPILKPDRPDSAQETLGFTKLDEPSPQQSDATVLELQLRALSKKSHLEPTFVRSIAEADKNPREIQKWIESVEELHRSKPPPQVRYSKPMPDVEALMQEWPEQIEALLSTIESPSADLDLSLEEFSRVACALTGVPVHNSEILVQSLHVLFTLYAEFRANQHFQVGGADGAAAASAGAFAAAF